MIDHNTIFRLLFITHLHSGFQKKRTQERRKRLEPSTFNLGSSQNLNIFGTKRLCFLSLSRIWASCKLMQSTALFARKRGMAGLKVCTGYRFMLQFIGRSTRPGLLGMTPVDSYCESLGDPLIQTDEWCNTFPIIRKWMAQNNAHFQYKRRRSINCRQHWQPIFYLADKAWELLHRLTLEDAAIFLRKRSAQCFNIIPDRFAGRI